jgi:hypothetical protein
MAVREPGVERSARRFDKWGLRLLGVAVALAALGGLIALVGHGTADWVKALGGMLAYIAVAPAAVGLALLGAALVSHWHSRHKPFA